MKLSIIDIGTSSIKHSIFEKDEYGKKLIHYQRYSDANLGESDPISSEAIERSLAILKECLAFNETQKVSKVRLLGTEILRKAVNAHDFIEALRDVFGLDIEIISQDKEALYLYEGFLDILKPGFEFGAINIGGGSTELVLGGDGLVASFKLPFGVKFIMKNFGEHDAIDWQKLDDFLDKEIVLEGKTKKLFITGVLGFMTEIRSFVHFEASSAEIPEHPFQLDMNQYFDWITRMRRTPVAELKEHYAKDSNYCNGVTIGQSVYYACARKLGVECIIPSARDLTDGVVYEMSK